MLNRGLVAFVISILVLSIFPSVVVSAQETSTEKGPIPDVIYVTGEPNVDVAVQKVANGSLDIFLWDITMSYITSRPEEILSNLSLVKATSSYWEITLNPVHDDDNPYLITVNGTKYFNPFAIREIRFALNWLINRESIVQDILQGSGAPMFGGIRPSTSADPYFESVYAALGLTAEGNEYRALLMIDEAMNKAAADLVARGYKLEKVNGTWYFEGKPVTVTGIIRVEDLRLNEGLYVADLLEKAGFKVNREIVDRGTAGSIVYGTDPKEYKWNFYTAGWVSTTNLKWPDDYTAWWYAGWYGWLPAPVGWEYKPTLTVKDFIDYIGGAENAITVLDLKYYDTPERLSELYNWTIEEITKLLVLKSVEIGGEEYVLEEGNVDQYWDLQKISMGLGIMDSVRVFTTEIWEYFIMNKDRVSYIASDISSGLWTRWALITAETPDKVVKIAEYSTVNGVLFMDAFNPVGGIQDVYSNAIWRVVRDYPLVTDLSTGAYIPVRCNYTVQRGPITIPDDAIIYNSTLDKWVAAHAGEEAKAKVTYLCKLSNWHDGQPMTIADFKYSIAFNYEWISKDGEDDPYYDENLASRLDNLFLSQIKGYEFKDNGDGTVTVVVYTDNVHPLADDITAANNAVWPTLPWQLLYAMGELVAKGDNYNVTANYAFSYEDETTGKLDLLVPEHVADLQKVLLSLKSASLVPASIADDVGDPTAGYDAVINWIDTHGHAVISNGPFYIDTYDSTVPMLVLRAFRDSTYPFTPQDILDLLQGTSEKLDITPPTIFNVNVEPETQEVDNVTTISWSVSDDSEVKSVTLMIEQPDGTVIEKTFDPSASVYSYDYTIPDVGTYVATIRAEDEFGNVNEVSIEFYGQKTIVETIEITNETNQVTVQDEDIELGIDLNESATTEGQIVVNVTVTTNEEELYEENVTSLAVAPVVANTTEENETQIVAPVKYVAVDVETQTSDNETTINVVEKYTLKISYTDEEIAGINENTLSIYYWNGTAWIKVVDYINQTIPNGPFVYDAGVNTDENYVWAVVDHFSVYALGGVPMPTVKIIYPEDNAKFFTNTTANVTITWRGKDEFGIDHYEIKVNDREWVNVGLLTEYTLKDLTYGSYTVFIKAVNLAGKEAVDSVTFEICKPVLSKPAEHRMNMALMWWMMYNHQIQKFNYLYNKSIELGIDNETLQEALYYKGLAEKYYEEAMEWGSPLKAFVPQQLRPLRLAYVNLLKAVKILEKALRTVS